MARPDLGSIVRAVIADLGRAAPEILGPVDPARVLVVAAAARRDARATIRPLAEPARAGWVVPKISIGGVPITYELALRPRWFLTTTAEGRALTLAHELWHAGPAFDGTLPAARRHRQIAGAEVEAEVRALVDAWKARSRAAAELVAALGAAGEYRMTSWLVRPPSRIPADSRVRRAYDERDLYEAIVELR